MEVVIILILFVITAFQVDSFIKNKREIDFFKEIFPEEDEDFFLYYKNETNVLSGIETQHKNQILQVIFKSINNYLSNNLGAVSDFHLIKDIVDRNCDSKEEEIHSQIPVPIYLGLAGTMTGILLGVGSLVFTGGLSDLINPTNGSGVDGIQSLLGGVALAMISSIIGIGFNIWGSKLAKEAKIKVEKNKNTFLSWMQAELLPNISNDTSGALVRMTDNLSKFNITFSENTRNLGDTFSKVNDSYKDQASLMRAIQELNITEIATANIDVYDKLKNSTDEIEVFAKYLQKTNEYLTIIHELSQNLGDYEKRTRVIEDAGRFFQRNELWLTENMDIASLEMKKAIERFNTRTEEYLLKLRDSLNGQILSFEDIIIEQQRRLRASLDTTTDIVAQTLSKTQQTLEEGIAKQQRAFEDGLKLQQETMISAIENQQKLFENKFQENATLVDELKNLTSIKEGVNSFKEATNKQNEKIDALTKEIRNLAKSKSIDIRSQNGGVHAEEYSDSNSHTITKKKKSLPKRFMRRVKMLFKSN